MINTAQVEKCPVGNVQNIRVAIINVERYSTSYETVTEKHKHTVMHEIKLNACIEKGRVT